MAKGGKSTLEKQLQIYGGIQKTLRGMNNEEHDAYASPGTPGYERHQKRIENEKEFRKELDESIARYDKQNRPMYGNLKGLTEEQVHDIAKQATEFRLSRAAYVEALTERLEKKYGFKSGYTAK